MLPSGHVPFPSGHKTELVFSSLTGVAAVLVNHVILTLLSPRSHFPAAELHVVPSGQQWRWSLQHTACKEFEKRKKINFDCLKNLKITHEAGISNCTSERSPKSTWDMQWPSDYDAWLPSVSLQVQVSAGPPEQVCLVTTRYKFQTSRAL